MLVDTSEQKKEPWSSPWDDDLIGWPPKPSEPGSELDEKDAETIIEVVGEAASQAKAKSGGKPILLHLGIGVGNPTATLKDLQNPSGDLDKELRAWQINPPFLADGIRSGYFV